MGRHRDQDTIAFIKLLLKKGKELGFWVSDEYELVKGQSFVDVVWKVNEAQPPLITFEIETESTDRVFKNTAKIFDSESDIVTKPWFHFMIIVKSDLSKSNRTALFRYLKLHNIKLFESIHNNRKLMREFEKELEKLSMMVKSSKDKNGFDKFREIYEFGKENMGFSDVNAQKFTERWLKNHPEKDFTLFKEVFQFALTSMERPQGSAQRFTMYWMDNHYDKDFSHFKKAYAYARTTMNKSKIDSRKFAIQQISRTCA